MMDSHDHAALNRSFEAALSKLTAEFNGDGLGWLDIISGLKAEIEQIKDEELSANEHFVLEKYGC